MHSVWRTAMQPLSRTQARTQGTFLSPAAIQSAAIALVATLFLVAAFAFVTRDVSRLDLLRATFSPGSQADYAFTLEQRVAPQRAAGTDAGARPAD